jgi:serine/threonine-protein kinase RsbW
VDRVTPPDDRDPRDAAEPAARPADPAGPHERHIGRVTLAAERAYLGAVLAFVREATLQMGLPAPDAAGMERAVEEVCLNLIEHGFPPGRAATFDVALLRRPGHAVVAVEDRGLPFDFAPLQAGAPSRFTASLATCADAIRFLNLGTGGNRVEIVKRLPFPAVDRYPAEAGAPPVAAPAPGTAPPPVTLRLMSPDDAVGVARCTYAVYGYTLPDDYLYFPDRIREMLHGGLLEVVVGVTADGDVASCLTCEVEHPGAPVGYIGEGLVDPRFRHHGLLEQMLAFVRDRARQRGLLGLYAEAVTVHPYSQRSNLALGCSEVGVQLADEAPSVVFEQMDTAASAARTATVLYYLPTREAPPRTVYPPPHHRAIVERIYAHGRFARRVETADVPAGPARAALKVDVFPEWSEAALRVTAYGADLVDQVRARLGELRRRRIDWIGLDVPLSHPAAQPAVPALERLGFFFAGVVPDVADGDVLRLQYLNEIEADVASAHIASPFGAELFAYVVEAMRARPDAG